MPSPVASSSLSVAASVAPEDLRAGQDVAVLTVTVEVPTHFWLCELPGMSAAEPVRIPFVSGDGGWPLRVKSVCLPFVLVSEPNGTARVLDVRRVQLVKLDRGYAKDVRKALRRRRPVVDGAS